MEYARLLRQSLNPVKVAPTKLTHRLRANLVKV